MSTDESVRAEPADDAPSHDDAPASGRRRGRRRGARGGGSGAAVPGSTDDEAVFVSSATTTPDDVETASGDGPRFWHRSHPVFTPLTGFFTGVLAVVVVVGLLGLILEFAVDYELSEHPWVILVALGVLLAINLALVVVAATRRFARYMLYGIITTPVIVFGTAALTFYLALEG